VSERAEKPHSASIPGAVRGSIRCVRVSGFFAVSIARTCSRLRPSGSRSSEWLVLGEGEALWGADLIARGLRSNRVLEPVNIIGTSGETPDEDEAISI
jgi:hypothetical protein